MLKIKITGSNGTERQNMQRCIAKFLRHNNQQVVESEKNDSGTKQVVTAAGPEVGLETNVVLVECDNTTALCRLDQKLIARATGATEEVVAQPEREWHVCVKRKFRAPENHIVKAINPDKAIRKIGDPENFESITVRPMK
ncbi:hypothetical protein MASR1M12_01210 [Erysipelotrichia bacterium]